jgi:hypothetical protein
MTILPQILTVVDGYFILVIGNSQKPSYQADQGGMASTVVDASGCFGKWRIGVLTGPEAGLTQLIAKDKLGRV